MPTEAIGICEPTLAEHPFGRGVAWGWRASRRAHSALSPVTSRRRDPAGGAVHNGSLHQGSALPGTAQPEPRHGRELPDACRSCGLEARGIRLKDLTAKHVQTALAECPGHCRRDPAAGPSDHRTGHPARAGRGSGRPQRGVARHRTRRQGRPTVAALTLGQAEAVLNAGRRNLHDRH